MTIKARGILLGSLAAVSYGTNPVFAVPLYGMGMTVSSVLVYRYVFATIILGVYMAVTKHSFKLSRNQVPSMIGMGILFALSSVGLFEAYKYVDVGIASTLLFVEPAVIALIMWAFFRERISLAKIVAIAVCTCGVACLCNPGGGAKAEPVGIWFVMGSALAYATYMIMVQKSPVSTLPGMTVTFYSLLFGVLVFAYTSDGFTAVQVVPANVEAWMCVLGLSIFPTIVSIIAVTMSIQLVGSVTVAILGALEPVTAIIFGVCIFSEIITPMAGIGITLILGSVLVLVSAPGKR